ncbi:MAG: response regulator [Microcystaceae cyanobacterium]
MNQELRFCLTQATTLTQGVEQLNKERFDLILIELRLEQESDLEPLLHIRETFPHIPIILLVENEAEMMIIRAFQGGADSCLSTKNIDSRLLIHEIRLVLERQNYRLRIEQQQQEKRQQQEFEDLEHLGGVSASITARLYGVVPLRENSPELFAQMCQDYGKLLDLALEQRAYRVEYEISGQLRELADKLGFLKASPKDIIDLHTNTIKGKTKDVTLAKSQAYIFEGRIMVLELMGYLTSFYRKYYIGLSNIKILGSS